MDLDEILQAISDAPIYVWVILFLIVGLLFKDKSRWEKEVNFRYKEGVGHGEVEIEHSKRRGTEIEVEMKLVEKYQDRPISIVVNDKLACTVPPQLNNGRGREFKARYQLGKPNSGDIVKVVIEGETLFSGEFR